MSELSGSQTPSAGMEIEECGNQQIPNVNREVNNFSQINQLQKERQQKINGQQEINEDLEKTQMKVQKNQQDKVGGDTLQKVDNQGKLQNNQQQVPQQPQISILNDNNKQTQQNNTDPLSVGKIKNFNQEDGIQNLQDNQNRLEEEDQKSTELSEQSQSKEQIRNQTFNQSKLQEDMIQKAILRGNQNNDDQHNMFVDLFKREISQQTLHQVKNTRKRRKGNELADYSIHNFNEIDYQKISRIFGKGNKEWVSEQEDDPKWGKCIAAFLGNAVGDALGAHTEFDRFEYNKQVLKEDSWRGIINYENQRTDYGVTTDDCSMARCMADSILCNDMKFNPQDMRIRFIAWCYLGYCNGSGINKNYSFGLGGNIAQGFQRFYPDMDKFVVEHIGDKSGNISGNGGIMRLSPIPIAYHDDIEYGEKIAYLQSLTTHNGYEAAEVCRMLTHLIIKLFNYNGNSPKKDVLDKLGDTFETQCPGVFCLANSQAESIQDVKNYDQRWNRSVKDRYWDWKNPVFQLSPTRHKQQPGYYGSYAMDGCYVALHIIYHSQNSREAIFKAVNWGGDSDSIAAVVGYVCGAMYGLTPDIVSLYNERMAYFDRYETLLKAHQLYHKHSIKTEARFFENNTVLDWRNQKI